MSIFHLKKNSTPFSEDIVFNCQIHFLHQRKMLSFFFLCLTKNFSNVETFRKFIFPFTKLFFSLYENPFPDNLHSSTRSKLMQIINLFCTTPRWSHRFNGYLNRRWRSSLSYDDNDGNDDDKEYDQDYNNNNNDDCLLVIVYGWNKKEWTFRTTIDIHRFLAEDCPKRAWNSEFWEKNHCVFSLTITLQICILKHILQKKELKIYKRNLYNFIVNTIIKRDLEMVWKM